MSQEGKKIPDGRQTIGDARGLFVRQTPDPEVAEHLQTLHHNDEDKNHGPHDFRHKALVAVTNGQVTQANLPGSSAGSNQPGGANRHLNRDV